MAISKDISGSGSARNVIGQRSPLRPVVIRFPAGFLAAIDAAVLAKVPERRRWHTRMDRSAFLQRLIAGALGVSEYDGSPRKKDGSPR
jgi:hypothetical protein